MSLPLLTTAGVPILDASGFPILNVPVLLGDPFADGFFWDDNTGWID